MFDEKDLVPEDTTDFTQFLSARLNLAPRDTLALLGSFLVNFEPSGRYSAPEKLNQLSSR
jgi:hypothetical protein